MLNDRLTDGSFRRRNVIFRPQKKDSSGVIRCIPYPVGTVYRYSSKRQNERNARRYLKRTIAKAA